MAYWALQCVNCEARFKHSEVNVSDIGDFLWASKPEFPPTEYKCPVCGHCATYKRTDLVYQLSSRAKAN
jgi:hypothetical protein